MSVGVLKMAAVVAAITFAGLPASSKAQKAEPFGREKVETREFRNKDVERSMNSRKPSHGHSHGKKSHKGHSH